MAYSVIETEFCTGKQGSKFAAFKQMILFDDAIQPGPIKAEQVGRRLFVAARTRQRRLHDAAFQSLKDVGWIVPWPRRRQTVDQQAAQFVEIRRGCVG